MIGFIYGSSKERAVVKDLPRTGCTDEGSQVRKCWLWSKQSRNLLRSRIKQLRVGIHKMSAESGIKLPHSWIPRAVSHHYGVWNGVDGQDKLAFVPLLWNFEQLKGTKLFFLKWIWLTCCSVACNGFTIARLEDKVVLEAKSTKLPF